MGSQPTVLRRHAARGLAVALIGVAAWWNYVPKPAAAELARLAEAFPFDRSSLEPVAGAPEASKAPVFAPPFQPLEKYLRAFLPTGAALTDLDGNGLADEACVTDPFARTVSVYSLAHGGAGFAAFTLPVTPRTPKEGLLPSGCLPGDFNEDGYTDLLVYFMGRTPVLFLRKADVAALSRDSFEMRDLKDGPERWYTQSVAAGDVDGDGHLDLVVGNYFPDKAHVLDDGGEGVSEMNDGWASAYNGAQNRLFLGTGDEASLFKEAVGAFGDALGGSQWTIAVGAADLDDDALPEIFFINDHGPDRLLSNRSRPGHPAFELVKGKRDFSTPKSKTLGLDDFHGMGLDFADLNHDGRLDWVVPNFGGDYMFHQSHHAWIDDGQGASLKEGRSPFIDRSEDLGLARTANVPWDVRLADFDNDGETEAFFSAGFMRGTVNRAPEMQEMAMFNDIVLRFPAVWHRFGGDDDLSGNGANAFFVRGPAGRYVDIGETLGFHEQGVSRGAAVGDVNGDGRLDLLVTHQFGRPSLYTSRGGGGRFLDLDVRLVYRAAKPDAVAASPRGAGLRGKSRAATGAVVRIVRADGRKDIGIVGGGHGYGGKSAPNVHFGLGQADAAQSVDVEIAWRGHDGAAHKQSLKLTPGAHTVWLGDGAEYAENTP